jgi:acetoin utilization deacetylase AcuC-like enzyme
MFSIIYSDRFLDHDTGSYHPERPQRLTAIVDALQAAPFCDRLTWRTPTPLADRDARHWVEQVHDADYIDVVQQLAQRPGGGAVEMDTPVSPHSYDVALLAVNAWLDGVDLACDQEPAFILARPPGHHATAQIGMGFCLFSNAAIAAHYALTKPEIERVAILDWDVHHGNGTQAIVEQHPAIAYCSLHQWPCYPGTGKAEEQGNHHNVLNIPMGVGSDRADYQTAFTDHVLPFLTQARPDLLIVSAGYDANQDDPLAGVSLHPDDFGAFTTQIRDLAPHLMFGLEGGYDLPSLSASVVATIAAYLEPTSIHY